jgi:hypothetical protein
LPTTIDMRSGALKGRSTVHITHNEAAAEEKFLTLFNDFARATSEVWPISKHVVERFRHKADILIVHLDEQPIVVNLVLLDPDSGRVRGLYNASRRPYVNVRKEARLIGNLNRYYTGTICVFIKTRALIRTTGVASATTKPTVVPDLSYVLAAKSLESIRIYVLAHRVGTSGIGFL